MLGERGREGTWEVPLTCSCSSSLSALEMSMASTSPGAMVSISRPRHGREEKPGEEEGEEGVESREKAKDMNCWIPHWDLEHTEQRVRAIRERYTWQ